MALVVTGYASSTHTRGANPKIVSSRFDVQSVDEAVVNTALVSFFEDTAWNTDWNKGDFVILDTRWARDSRPAFLDLLAARIKEVDEQSRRWAEARALLWTEAKLLRNIRESIGKDTFKADELPSLAGFMLDPRILPANAITIPDQEIHFFAGAILMRHWSGQTGTIRTHARLYPPTYSQDGRFSIVSAHVPWSIHTVRFDFYLERKHATWDVINVAVTRYL